MERRAKFRGATVIVMAAAVAVAVAVEVPVVQMEGSMTLSLVLGPPINHLCRLLKIIAVTKCTVLGICTYSSLC
jgi:hypothetical protein